MKYYSLNNNPKLIIDLHTHSTFSDGTLTPEELINLAYKQKLSAIAIADHDTVGGVKDFLQTAENFSDDLTAIPGVEISTTLFNREVHIVGLFIDAENQQLNDFLQKQRTARQNRNEIIVKKLQTCNYDISIEELKKELSSDAIGRPHIAAALIKKGYFSTPQEIFDKLLRRGKPCFEPRPLPPVSEAIEIIHEANGIAIWAHPVYQPRKGQRHQTRKFAKKLKSLGLDGIETYYTVYNEQQQKMLQEIAQGLDLLESGGSDFHGENQPKIMLGKGYGNLSVPYKVYEKMIEYIAQRN
ncbi:PHP domain-containing protein [Lentisphaerota bacterium WC36G]|nr:PHP domain-containing protein [Lentisphaerae bacterium WC36]